MRTTAVVVWLVACGKSDEALCGPGTELVDGVCVPSDPTGEDTAPPGDDDDQGDDDDDDDDNTSVPSDPEAPKILSVSSNVVRMTERDELNVTAIVTDPNGIDDLIGGELKSPTGASYGAFVTSAQEGAYEITLSWADLHTVEAIDFQHDEPIRAFEVQFFDQAGHVTRQDLEITLYCDLGSACDAVCKDLDNDEEACGSCDHSCVIWSGYTDQCQVGSCVEESQCTQSYGQTCTQICAAEGRVCAALTYNGSPVYAWIDYYADTCDSSEGRWTDGGCNTRLSEQIGQPEIPPRGASCLCR